MKTYHLTFGVDDDLDATLKDLSNWLNARRAPADVVEDLEHRTRVSLGVIAQHSARLGGLGAAAAMSQIIESPPYRVILRASSKRPGLIHQLLRLITR